MPRAPRHLLIGASASALSCALLAGSTALAHDLRLYDRIEGGEWSRTENLKDTEGRFQARQEHTAIALEGFVYVINGFVPIQPEPEPTEEDPEPFRFTPTNEMLVYVPAGHAAAEDGAEGQWRVLDRESRFPHDTYHHMMAAIHDGEIWAIGGHSGDFDPVDTLYIFRPNGEDDPDGTWRQIDANGEECEEDCLALPGPRAAGAAVTLDNTVIVLGGVIPNEGTEDPNETIRATNSVIYIDTSETPYEWRNAPPMVEAREHFNAVVADGRVWAFHGRRADNTRMRGVESWAPGEPAWRQEPSAPIGTSANILAAIDDCVYSFGGEFNANNVTGTVIASQVFHVPSRTWRLIDTDFADEPYGADPGVMSKHGTYGLVYEEDGQQKIMAPGGASLAWFAPMSRVHIFTPPDDCE